MRRVLYQSGCKDMHFIYTSPNILMPFFQNILTEIYKTLKQNYLIDYYCFDHKIIRQKDQSQPYL